jgi:hypothetical protein
MWHSSCFGCFLEMRSAFIEVQAIREDLNARRRKGEHPEKECYELALCRWNDAIAALAEVSCLSEIRPAGRWARGSVGVFGFQPIREFLIASLVTAGMSRVLSEHPSFRTRSNYAKSNQLRRVPVPNLYLFGTVSTKNHP